MKSLFHHAQKRVAAFGRILVAIAVLASPLAFAAPANAGTISSPTWTVMDPRTNIAGNRYDYGFTTASTQTVSRVTATVPAGTTGSNRYYSGSGASYNDVTTPDSVANSFSGDIDIRAKIAPRLWKNPGGQRAIAAKFQNGQRAFRLELDSSGRINLITTSDGNTDVATGGVVPNTVDGQPLWVRVTRKMNDGSGNHIDTFYTSTDGNNWTSWYTPITTGTTSIFDSSAPFEVGSMLANGFNFDGKIYYVDVRSGISGTTTSPSSCNATGVVNCFDPNNDTIGGTSWTSASSNAETWTVNRNLSTVPADIASDLSVMKNSGLPTGGTAQLREIDGVASYTLPTATSIASGTVVKLGLAGMTNTFTANTYTSVVKTTDSNNTALDTSSASNSIAITTPILTTIGGSTPLPTTAVGPTSIQMAPIAMATYGTHVYISDTYAANLYDYDTSTNLVTRLAGIGAAGYGGTEGGPASALGFNEVGGVAVDSSGNVAIADRYGCRIRLINVTTKNFTTLAGTGTCSTSGDGGSATSATINSPIGISFDSSNNLYIAENVGNVVRKVSGGIISTVIASGTLTNPVGLTVDSANNVYVADQGNSVVRKLTPGGALSVYAGGGTCGSSPYGDGAAATSACISGIWSLGVDASNNIYLVDSNHLKVRKVDASTGFISTVIGSGTLGYTGDGGAATSASTNYPTGFAITASGTMYLGDMNSRALRAVTSGTITTVAGQGPFASGDGGNAAQAQFYSPTYLATDPNGNLLVSEAAGARIRSMDQWGTMSTVAGNGIVGNSGDGAAATAGSINQPTAVTTDAAGNVYIANTLSRSVRKVTKSTGFLSTLATSTNNVYGVAVDPTGTSVYFSTSCGISRVPVGGGTVTPVAGTGTCTYNLDAAADPLTVALNIPRGMAFDSAGNLFIADSGNYRIREILASTGALVTAAGGGASTADNVKATTASLAGPWGITIDSIGRIYITESSNGRIRRFTPGGSIVTIAGTGITGFGGDGGSALSAQLSKPAGIAIANGQLYITDRTSERVRKIADIMPMAPLVNADTVSVAMNTATRWPILSNDWSRNAEMDPSSVLVTTSPTHGTVTLENPSTEAATLQALYTPTTGYTGSDSFTYSACDTTKVLCGSATVTLTVSSNEYTTVAGAAGEGYATTLPIYPETVSRYRNYLFVADTVQAVVHRLDIYTGQMTNIAGTGIVGNGGSAIPAASTPVNQVKGMAFAPDGTMVLTDGGINKVRLITTAGTISTVAGITSISGGDGGPATSAGLNYPTGISYGPDGLVYVSEGVKVRKFVIGGNISTVAGSGSAGSSGDGGLATAALLTSPRSILFLANGDLLIADSGVAVVRRVNTAGVISTFAGSGTVGFAGDGGPATSAQLSGSRGLSLDSAGNVLIGDASNSRIRKVNTTTNIISTVAGGGTSFSDNVAATTSSMVNATNVVAGTNGDFWVTDQGNNRVRYVNSAGVITTAVGTGASYGGPDGFNAMQTQFDLTNVDTPIVADATGNIYVAEVGKQRIRRIDATTGLVSTVAGNGTGGNSQTNISAAQQLSFDSSGNLVFGEYSNCQVRRRNSDGSLTLLAGNGSCGTTPVMGGSATATSLGHVWGAYMTSAGDLFIGDDNNRIYKVSGGVITAYAGTGVSGATGDGGPASTATISQPRYITSDRNGNIYFADASNQRIRMIDRNGTINTVAGNGTAATTGDGGLATAASIYGPKQVAFDAAGNMFIAETFGAKLRKVDANTGVISTVSGTGTSAYSNNVTNATATLQQRSGFTISGADVDFIDVSANRIRKVAGVASTTSSSLATAAWSIVPPATGHTNLRERLNVTPSATVTSSKITMTVPTPFALTSPTAVETYGLTGTVTPTLSGSTLSLAFTSQSLTATVPIGISLEGVSNGGANGAFTTNVAIFDSAGTTSLGGTYANTVNITASGAPVQGGAGFGSLWKRNLATTASAFPTVAVSPSGTADTTSALTLTNSGTMNANGATLAATAMNTASSATLSPVTADSTTSVTSAAFPLNRWGLQFATTTGTNSTSGSGYFSGLTSASIATGGSATNVLTITPRARVNYLASAGTYKSSLTWRFTGGV